MIKEVLAAALSTGGDLSEIFVEDRSSNALRLDDGRIEDVASGSEAGAGIRVLAGDKMSYAYTNLLTRAALLEAAEAARAGIEGTASVSTIDLRRAEPGVVHPVRIPPDSVDVGDKVAVLRAADDAARSAGNEVRQVSVSYMDVAQNVLVANSQGRLVSDARTRLRFAVQVVAARDGEIATGFEAPGHSGGYELLDEHPAAELASKAAAKALRMLDARPSPAG